MGTLRRASRLLLANVFTRNMSLQSAQIDQFLEDGEYGSALARAQKTLLVQSSAEISFLAGTASRELLQHQEAIEFYKTSFEEPEFRAASAEAIAFCQKAQGFQHTDLADFQRSNAKVPPTGYFTSVWLEELSRRCGPEISLQVLKNAVPVEDHTQYVDAHLAGTIEVLREDIQNKEWNRAKAGCNAILARFGSPRILAFMGYISQQTGDLAQAVKYCAEAYDAGLRDASNEYVAGLGLLGLDRVDDAIRAFERTNALAPEHVQSVMSLVTCLNDVRGESVAFETFMKLKGNFSPEVQNTELAYLGFRIFGDVMVPPAPHIVARLSTALDWARTTEGSVQWISDPYDIPVKSPYVICQAEESIETTVLSNAAYVTEISDATVFSKSNIVLSKDGYAVDDIGSDHRFGAFVSHQSDQAVLAQRGQTLLLNPSAYQLEHLDAGIMMSGAASGEFGHWVPEFLPKLQFYEHHPDYHRLPLIVDERMPQSHFDYLDCVAPDHDIIRLQQGKALSCDRLIYAPTATFFPIHLHAHTLSPFDVGPVSPRSYEFLQSKVVAKFGAPDPQGRKIFLTRKNMQWSKITNESAVSDYLKSQGFEIILIEEHDFESQVRLFRQASVVVASGGSALQSIIYSDTSTKLIVMTQRKLHNWGCFNGQVGALGYRPIFVCGTTRGDLENKHADYEISIKDLERALNHGAQVV